MLLVDDNLDTVHSMAVLLKTLGHEVQFAINGLAAIDIARNFRPEVILLDMGPLDFHGDQFANQLKREAGLEGARVIAISGRPGQEGRQRSLAAGCEDYYVKPLDPAVLEGLLAKP